MEPALREEPLRDTKDDLDVDKLTSGVDKLRLDLAELGCSIKGNKQTLQRRLKQVKKNRNASVTNEPPVQKDGTEKEKPFNELMNENSEYVSKHLFDDSGCVRPSIVLTLIFLSSQNSLPRQPFDYYLFFDVEATCEQNTKNYPHEIIEFPVLLVDGESFDIVSPPSKLNLACLPPYIHRLHLFCSKVDQYRSYVKPSINPTLSEFCTSLTGISQVR
jgi:Exonuclease